MKKALLVGSLGGFIIGVMGILYLSKPVPFLGYVTAVEYPATVVVTMYPGTGSAVVSETVELWSRGVSEMMQDETYQMQRRFADGLRDCLKDVEVRGTWVPAWNFGDVPRSGTAVSMKFEGTDYLDLVNGLINTNRCARDEVRL